MDQQRYRNIQFGSTLGSDCMGTVASPPNHSLYRQDMLVYPAVNWLDNASGGRMFLEKRLVYWGDARHGWDFRAVFQKGQVLPFSDVLIIGIGGGVAIWALQFCVTVGTRVWVTSSSKHIIKQACQLGAKGGVNSAKEFKQMVQFVNKHQIQPVVHNSLRGFKAVEEGIQIMKAGKQFGKTVVVIDPKNQHKL
ncbi:hypothetical protein PCANC_23660 [Puccinia coronata f. sp. avenae]|uniref:Alcohol dehydrogenase-like C-terminal domain-containing protein n=1 Tax=Puccinia coronata f. sp. avenae TaxID=200324 RepID=A0A2N5TQS3_9BASI|nr:hypothetical protein PCANC_23660 [Puccinia coronata f. sp. avenae]